MKRLVVVDVSVGVIFHTALVGSIYLLFAGHNQPGDEAAHEAAAVPLLLGEAVLTSAKVTVDAPLLGTINITSATAFDIGVYLVVVGVVLMAFEAFGGEPNEQPS